MNPDATISFPMFGDGFVLDFPRYFTIFGFDIYYYGLIITVGYALAGVYLIKRRNLFSLTKDNILDLLIIALICGIVGARLYYMLFNFDRFFGSGQWGNIIRFRDGGLAVYGGIIASGFAFIIYSRIKKIQLGNLLDAAGFGLFIGQAFGRLGNFVNREAFGVETDLPWRMGLTTGGVTQYVHPTFLYESLWNVVGLLLMHIFSKKSKTKYPGQYFLFYVSWYGIGRFMIEGLRIDSLMIANTDIRASQLLAALSFLAAVGILFVNFLRGKEALPAQGDIHDEQDAVSVYGEDAEDAEEAEDAKELSKLDGASTSEVKKESNDDDDEDKDTDDDEPVDMDDDSDDDDEPIDMDDVDAEDIESADDLSKLDGASSDEIENESEEKQ